MKAGETERLWQTSVDAIERRRGPRQRDVGRRARVFGRVLDGIGIAGDRRSRILSILDTSVHPLCL